jgi:uncharacterized membrane protein (UPF0127 family)
MAKNKTKMLVAILLSTISIVLVIGVEFFYLTVIDQKVLASSRKNNEISKVIGALLKKDNPNGMDLSESLTLEYATNETQREKGLMHRDVLCADCGMLFVFDNSDYLSFWMKNTFIPLDITFISADGTIINTEAASAELNSKDDSQYPTYTAIQPALYVLETNQGWIKKQNLKNGDKLDMSKILPKN